MRPHGGAVDPERKEGRGLGADEWHGCPGEATRRERDSEDTSEQSQSTVNGGRLLNYRKGLLGSEDGYEIRLGH